MAAALVVALLAGCSSDGSDPVSDAPSVSEAPRTEAPTASTTPDLTPAEPGEVPTPTIEWEDCGGGFECGTFDAPLDHDDPTGPTIEIAVTRHPAEDPDARIGPLVINPGGPGGSGISAARSFLRAGTIGDRFDIVGFDPRGVGDSTPLDCGDGVVEMYDADPTIDSPADREVLLETSEAFVDACAGGATELLPHLGTTSVARDMDLLRRALGEEQLTYLGYSYGSSLGQEYARLFPTEVRAMILDGIVDHAVDGPTMAASQAAGFERALDAYLADCEADGCGLPLPADEAIAEVQRRAEAAPIPAPDADRPATPGVVSLAITQALYSELLWGSLSGALRDALDGDGSRLVDLADQYLRTDSGDLSFGAYYAVSCLDDTWPADPDELLAIAATTGDEHPTFGEAVVNDYLRCSMWPVEPEPLAPVPADVAGLPTIVVVSTTNDPATPYENGVAVAEQIPGAVLVTNVGDGHTIVAQGKPCIDRLALAYLVDLEAPADGTRCT